MIFIYKNNNITLQSQIFFLKNSQFNKHEKQLTNKKKILSLKL